MLGLGWYARGTSLCQSGEPDDGASSYSLIAPEMKKAVLVLFCLICEGAILRYSSNLVFHDPQCRVLLKDSASWAIY